MSRQETSTRGPERFAAPVLEEERPSLGRAAAAFAALLVLLVGVPVLLWVATGPPPVPTGLPDNSDLTAPISVETLLVVLRAVVWLAWLQFAVCTVVEVLSVVRGGGLPRPVPLSGLSQGLARALVGSILVGVSVLGSPAAQAVADVPAAGTVSATTVQGIGDGASVDETGPAQEAADDSVADESAPATPQMEHLPGVPADMTDVIGRKVAIVEPPQGHYHDNLWDIAERHLDDGRRWKEIYELNQGRLQPDGQQLVLGRLIQPGWVLIMPDDATGVPRVQAAADPVAPEDRGPGAARDTAVAPGPAAADLGTEQAADDRAASLLTGGVLAGVLGAVLFAERRRRRGLDLTDAELDAEVALRVGADDERVTRLDEALRGLSALCRAERAALPQVYAVLVTDDAVELQVAPAAPAAPAPWSSLDDGRRWRLERDADLPDERGHAPYPGLVCLGRDDTGADVFVDLEAVGGPLALDGSDTVAREVVSALAVQLATAPWADEQRVVGHHLEPVLATIAGGALESTDDVTGLVAAWVAERPRAEAQEVLGGRLGRHPGTPPRYLVLGSRPGAESLAALDQLLGAGSRGVGVVCAVPLPGARWKLTVDEAGRLAVPLLDLEVDAVRLTATAADAVAGLLTKARTPLATPAGERVAVPATPYDGDDSHWRAAEVRVGVLGPLELRAAGALDAARLDLAQELVTFLALQPAPVHPSVVGASVWPRGVTPEVRDATVARARDWLGTDADGNALLRETAEGRLHLAPDVAVDWHALCVLARRSRECPLDEEREVLRRALQLVRGEPLAGRPVSRYAWVVRTRLESQAVDVVVDAAHRLAELSFDDDPAGASAACRAGLRLAPTSQVLWRDLLTAEDRHPDGPGTAAVVDEMVRALQLAHAPLEAETEALVVELVPHPPGAEASA